MHELQQESADKEVKLVQASKQRAQDKEDINGLNIALDSKQQEVDYVRVSFMHDWVLLCLSYICTVQAPYRQPHLHHRYLRGDHDLRAQASLPP